MAAYLRDGKWRYRKRVMLPDGRSVRIAGTPAINTKECAEEYERARSSRVIAIRTLDIPSGSAAKAGFVYVVQCLIASSQDGPVKIGREASRYSRLSSLQTGCPFELKSLVSAAFDDAERAEREIHGRFEHLRIRGEWFRWSREIRDLVRDLEEHQRRHEEQIAREFFIGGHPQ